MWIININLFQFSLAKYYFYANFVIKISMKYLLLSFILFNDNFSYKLLKKLFQFKLILIGNICFIKIKHIMLNKIKIYKKKAFIYY